MLRIGDFSKLSQVTVKALRHYDEIGLLKPARVDDFTGYRYYTASQLPTLNRIVALKNMGLSLTDVARLTTDKLTVEQMRAILRQQYEDTRQRLTEEQKRLTRLESWLEHAAKEEIMQDYEVTIKNVPAIRVATLRRIIPNFYHSGELWQEFCQPMDIWAEAIADAPGMSLCHDTEYKESDVDVEIALPTKEDARVPDHATVRELPAIEQAASLTVRGGFENLKDAHFSLLRWIEENGYQIAGPDRELYIKGPGQDVSPDEYITEIQLPIEKA
jgi:DNA-binding transcriptional MerR regulator/effector-binding domain-containing protein